MSDEQQKGTEIEVRKSTPARSTSRVPSPFDELEQMFESFFPRRFGGWLRPFGDRPALGDLLSGVEGRLPKMDMVEREDAIVVKAEVPGMSKDDIEVTVVGDELQIKGTSRHETVEEEKGRHYLREISSQSFERWVTLPAAVDAEKATATLKDGVLELTLPKREKAVSHKISIG